MSGAALTRPPELLLHQQAGRAALRAEARDARHEPFVSAVRTPVPAAVIGDAVSAITEVGE